MNLRKTFAGRQASHKPLDPVSGGLGRGIGRVGDPEQSLADVTRIRC